jgi:hypothetical protein
LGDGQKAFQRNSTFEEREMEMRGRLTLACYNTVNNTDTVYQFRISTQISRIVR